MSQNHEGKNVPVIFKKIILVSFPPFPIMHQVQSHKYLIIAHNYEEG